MSVTRWLRLIGQLARSAFVRPVGLLRAKDESVKHAAQPKEGSRATATGAGALASVLRESLTPTGVPMPKIVHRVLSGHDVHDRILVIGDVHGCLHELQALLARAAYVREQDTVILVGDLVNKGPLSAEVVRFVRESGFYCVRGNHDDSAISASFRIGKYARNIPDSYQYVSKFSREDADWLRELPYTISIPHRDVLVVHAGLLPGVPLNEQKAADMSRIRGVILEGGQRVGVDKARGAEPWTKLWKGPQHIFYGHDARRGLTLTRFASGLDTGCCYGKELTAAVVGESERFSVSAARQYAPLKE